VGTLERLDLPPVIGHRGVAAYAPENTLAAFRAARALRRSWIEFDVRLTADHALVVCHDDKLDRTTNGSGRISKMPLAAVRRLDAGSWFGAGFAGEAIPTLDEALILCREIGLGANIEIKAEGSRGPATATTIAGCLAGFVADLPPILISSFLPEAVAEAGVSMPSVPRGMLWRKIPRNWATVAARLGCLTIHCGHADLTAKLAADISAADYPLLCYTVNDAARARQLFDWGVASVFSDAPDIIAGAPTVDVAGARRGASL
jgi:glycerophosphoryl diester phosphodiesterase